MAKWQKIDIKVRKSLGPREREAVALAIISEIKRKTASGVDWKDKPFDGYSESYIDSLDFKAAGKSPGNVNLELSSEMMNSIQVLSSKAGQIRIGFDKGDAKLNAKVEGNRLGTYGQKKPILGKARDFLGIKRDVLKEIQDRFDVKGSTLREVDRIRANRDRILAASETILQTDSIDDLFDLQSEDF